jgi:hypothetical protein
MSPSASKPPEILDKIVDLMLAHKPKPPIKGCKEAEEREGEETVSMSAVL